MPVRRGGRWCSVYLYYLYVSVSGGVLGIGVVIGVYRPLARSLRAGLPNSIRFSIPKERSVSISCKQLVLQKLSLRGVEFACSCKYGPVRIPRCQAEAHACSKFSKNWIKSEEGETRKLAKFNTSIEADGNVHKHGFPLSALIWSCRTKKDADVFFFFLMTFLYNNY